MKINKLSVCIAFAATLSVSVHANTAKSIGMGMTGVTGDFTNATVNPSLINNYKSNDDVYFTLSTGASFKDGDETIDSIEKGSDAIKSVESSLNSFNQAQNMQTGQSLVDNVNNLNSALKKLDNNIAEVGTGVNFMVAIPNSYASLAFFGEQQGRFSAHLNYNENDSSMLDDIVNDVTIDPSNVPTALSVDSELILNGYSVSDIGLIMGQNHTVYGQSINFGGALKYQRIDVVQLKEKFDSESDEFDTDNAIETDHGFNIDFGLDTSFGSQGQYQIGLVAKDIISREVRGVEGGVFTLDPSVVLGFGYDVNWFKASLEADLVEHTGFEELEKLQQVKAGVQFNAWNHAQLRAGYKMDLNDDDASVVTAGIGISPWDIVGIDLGAYVGKGDSMGASVQIGFKI